jgi:hypothetical protein
MGGVPEGEGKLRPERSVCGAFLMSLRAGSPKTWISNLLSTDSESKSIDAQDSNYRSYAASFRRMPAPNLDVAGSSPVSRG